MFGRDASNYDYQNAKILVTLVARFQNLLTQFCWKIWWSHFHPLVLEQNIQVKILGNVKSPGEFTVPINSTLQDLYVLAGGLEPSADDKSIIFARESLKEKEKTALQSAKRILIDSIISRSSSASEMRVTSSSHYCHLSELGNRKLNLQGGYLKLSFNSNTSKNLLLENGDTIICSFKIKCSKYFEASIISNYSSL